MKYTANHDQAYSHLLIKVFGQMSELEIAQILSNTKTLNYKVGAYLFKQGDTENALYIVLSGRLRVFHETANGIQVLGDVSVGEPVGELALFTKEPRIASVVAIRKSVVLKIEEADYNILAKQNPHFAHTLTQYIINRLRRNAFQQRMEAAPKNIAILKLQPELDISPWTDDVKQELVKMDIDTNVYSSTDQSSDNPDALFEDMENREGMNFLVCDEQDNDWSKLCIAYCDLILVVSDFYASAEIRSVEEQLKFYTTDILSKKIYLILLHPENAPLPVHTRRWFEGRNINLHLHIRKNNACDTRRFSRIITHRAVGLVLGGGGAKGFSHVGAAKAMLEAGIEFDFIGGTSAGALFGICMTVSDLDIEKSINLCQKGAESKPTTNDYNFPFLSLMSGRKMRKLLKDVFGETNLEDIWVTTYCVSTNYSTASLTVHESGLARQKIEASVAIPGVFPPVIIDHHLHVDGGVMDNLPIEAMYQKPVSHVIAIALNSQLPHIVEIETVPSAWEFFINKFTKKRRFKLPQMSALLINSLTLNSVQKQEATKSQVSLYMEMDLRKFGFLDWSQWRELIENGYQQTQAFLNALPTKEQFWK